MTRILPLGVLAIVLGAVTPALSAPVATTAATRVRERSGEALSLAEAIVALSNRERRRAGLDALELDARLVSAARHHALNMAREQQMAHVLPGADLPLLDDRLSHYGFSYGNVGENVAMGYPTALAVVAGWMASPGHRANLLSPAFTLLGVGVSRETTADRTAYYCQVFGRPRR